MIWEVGVERER